MTGSGRRSDGQIAALLTDATDRGLTRRQLADEQSVTPGAVGHWEKRCDIALPRLADQARHQQREDWRGRLTDACARGLTRSELAREHGVTTGQVSYWERLHDIELLAVNDQWRQRLTDAAAAELTTAEVAAAHDVHPRTVRNWQRRCGIELPAAATRVRERRDDQLTALLTDATARGIDTRALAAEQGVAPETVRTWQQRAGVHLPGAGTRGPQQQTAILEDAVARSLTASELAAEQGVHLDTVAYWQKRRGIKLIGLRARWAAVLHDARDRQLTRAELAAELDVTTDKVGHWERTSDIRLDSVVARRHQHHLQRWTEQLEGARGRGLDRYAFAAQHGVHKDTVRKWELRCAIELPTEPIRRSNGQLELLQDAQARGLTRGELADELDVNASRIAKSERRHAVRLADGRERARRRRKARWVAVLADATTRGLDREQVSSEQQVGCATVRKWEKVCETSLTSRTVQAQAQQRGRVTAAVASGVVTARTAPEVAADLDVSVQIIYRRASQMNVRLAPARTGRSTRPDARRLRTLIEQHGNVAAVAVELGAAASTVRRWCVQDRVALEQPTELPTNAWDDPLRLTAAIARGMTVAEIARDAGTDRTVVGRWLADYGLGRRRTRLAWAARLIAERHDGNHAHGIDRHVYAALPERSHRRLDVVRAWLDRDGVTLEDATSRQLRAWIVACHGHGSASSTILEATYAIDRYDQDSHRDRPRGADMRDTLDQVHQQWGSNPTPRRTVAVPLVVLRQFWETTPAQVLAATRRRGVADATYEIHLRLLRIWVAVGFANGCRGQAPGHLSIKGLLNPAPKTIWDKGGTVTLHTGHTPGCSLCPQCEVQALLAIAPELRRDLALHELIPSRDLMRKQWLRAAGLPEYAVTLGTARVTVATLLWQRTHNLVEVGRLLDHTEPGGHVTTRYIQTLPQMHGLESDDFDRAGWLAYAEEQHRRRCSGRQAAAALPSMRLPEALDSAPLRAPSRPRVAPAPQLPAALWWWTAFLGGDLGVVEMCSADPRHPDNLLAWAICLHDRNERRTATVRAYAHALAKHLHPTDTVARGRFLAPTLEYLRARAQSEKKDGVIVQPTLVPMPTIARWANICHDRRQNDLGRTLGWGFGTRARPGSLYAITMGDVTPEISGIRNVDINVGTKRQRHDTLRYTVPVDTAGPMPLMMPNFPAGRSLVDGVAVYPSSDGPRRPDRPNAASHDWKRMLDIVAAAGEAVPAGTSPMTLRHSSLTYDWEQSRDLLYVQSMAGHSSPMTTLIYLTTVSTDMRTEAGRTMAGQINGAWTSDLAAARELLTARDVPVPPGLLQR